MSSLKRRNSNVPQNREANIVRVLKKLKNLQLRSILTNSNKNQSQTRDFKCLLIRSLTVREGTLRITDESLFFYYETISQKESHLALVRFQIPEDRLLYKEWPLSSILKAYKRR